MKGAARRAPHAKASHAKVPQAQSAACRAPPARCRRCRAPSLLPPSCSSLLPLLFTLLSASSSLLPPLLPPPSSILLPPLSSLLPLLSSPLPPLSSHLPPHSSFLPSPLLPPFILSSLLPLSLPSWKWFFSDIDLPLFGNKGPPNENFNCTNRRAFFRYTVWGGGLFGNNLNSPLLMRLLGYFSERPIGRRRPSTKTYGTGTVACQKRLSLQA